MKAVILILGFLTLISFNTLSDDLWKYYPIGIDGNPSPIYEIEKDSSGKIYFATRVANKIYIYNSLLNTWNNFKIQVPSGIVVDLSNNLWITSIGDGLVKFNGDDTTQVNHLLSPQLLHKNLQASISCDEENNIWIGYGPHIFKINDNTAKYYNVNDLGIDKIFVEEKIIVKDKKIIFSSMRRDSIFIINPDAPNNKIIFKLTDYGIPDTAKVEWIQKHNNEIYVMINHSLHNNSKMPIREIYHLTDEGLSKVELNYLNTLNLYWLRQFTFDDYGNMILFIRVSDGTNLHGELIYYKDGKMQVIYQTPDVEENGITKNYYETISLLSEKNNIWMCQPALGLLRFSKPVVNVETVEDDIPGHNVWIHKTYPNPVKSIVTIDYFCIPTKRNELKVEIFNILGFKTKDVSYDIIEYDENTGLGKMMIDLSGNPHGFNLICLKAGGTSFAKGIILLN